jgi:hypothetical protein
MRIFVSFTNVDLAWALWVVQELRSPGHNVDYYLDWPPGTDIQERIDTALRNADLVVAVVSKAYLRESRYAAQVKER